MNLPQVAERYWFSLEKLERRRYSLVFVIALVYLIHYLVFCIPQPFYIEDAGISFAFARNFADGEGFVGYPGGERVEGFSNPLWTFILSGLYTIGMSPWTSAKILGAIFGAATLGFVYGVSKRMAMGGTFALLPILMLSLSPQFVIWNAGGLENPLYGLLLSWGTWRLLVEDESAKRYPVSALLFSLAAITRPEGIMYGLIAFFAKTIFTCLNRRWLNLILWLVILLIPFAAYCTWRYQYFAWELPNTYYAKLGKGDRFLPFDWTRKGWKYINNYLGFEIVLTKSGAFKELKGHGLGYVLPIMALGMSSFRGWRFRWSMVLMLPLCLLCLWDGKPDTEGWFSTLWFVEIPKEWKFDKTWVKVRVWGILAYAIWLGLINLGQAGWKARSTLWTLGAASVFFALYSGGDWMDQFRWFHIIEIFLFPVLAEGLYQLYSALPQRWSTGSLMWRERYKKWGKKSVVALFVIAFGTIEITNTVDFAIGPETSVNDIRRRVNYMKWVQSRLDVDHVTLLDVDMGAHMYYSGWDIVDIAGLIDVSMAQHSDFNFKFIEQYVFEERNPEFAHCHGGWAKQSRIPKHKEWKERYLEIPGYPVGGRTLHIGNHVRKDLFIQEYEPEQHPNSLLLSEGLSLEEWSLSAAEVAPGSLMYLYTAWHAEKQDADIQAWIALVDPQSKKLMTVAAFQPGFRWYNIDRWEPDELIEGRFQVPIPKDIPLGTYELLLVVVDHKEAQIHSPSSSEEYSFLPGEISLGKTVTIVSETDAKQAAEDDLRAAVELAKQGDCESSWPMFKESTRHILRNRSWRNRNENRVRETIALCYIQRAQRADREEKITLLQTARFWDHRVNGLTEASAPLAEELDEEATRLFEEAEEKNSYILGKKIYKKSYETYLASIRLDPTRSWTRRRLEETRDKYLRVKRPAQKRKERKEREKKRKEKRKKKP